MQGIGSHVFEIRKLFYIRKVQREALEYKKNWMLFLFIYGDVYESRRQEYTRVLLLFARSKRDGLIYREFTENIR